MSSVFLVAKPSKIILFIQNTIPQKGEIILLHIPPNKILLICPLSPQVLGASSVSEVVVQACG